MSAQVIRFESGPSRWRFRPSASLYRRWPSSPVRLSCPTTEGVSCTCRLSPILCETCDFFDGREFLQCTFNFTLTVECEACRPVRGLAQVSMPL